MKIELTINADESIFLNARLHIMQETSVTEFKKLDLEKKALHTILMDVSDIITKKNKSILRKDSLFDQNKTYKVSLKYHEAKALYAFIRRLTEVENDDHKPVSYTHLTLPTICSV